MENGLTRQVINVRDPRQATLSWTHHIDKYLLDNLDLQFYPPLPGEYRSWDFKTRVDWNINNHLPNLIRWLEGWHEHSKTNALDITFVRYEDMVKDESNFFRSILDAFGIDIAEHRELTNRPDVYHFRSGRTNEW